MNPRVSLVSVLLALLLAVPATASHAKPRDLAAERLAAAADLFAAAKGAYDTGTGTVDAVYTWSVRWLEAASARATARGAHLDRMKALEATAKEKVASGLAPTLDVKAAAYFRVEAELWARRGTRP